MQMGRGSQAGTKSHLVDTLDLKRARDPTLLVPGGRGWRGGPRERKLPGGEPPPHASARYSMPGLTQGTQREQWPQMRPWATPQKAKLQCPRAMVTRDCWPPHPRPVKANAEKKPPRQACRYIYIYIYIYVFFEIITELGNSCVFC